MIDANDLRLELEDLVLLYFGTDTDLVKEDQKDEIIKPLQGVKSDELDKALVDLENKGLISKISEERDGKNLDYFTLTEEGETKRSELWGKIKDENVILIDEKDLIHLNLENAVSAMDEKSLLDLLTLIKKDNIIDLREETKQNQKLVGRDEQLEKLNKDIENLNKEKGNTIFIAGDTGIGKTRLVEELKKTGIEKGFDFLKGQCYPEDYTPYGPIEETLEKFLQLENKLKQSKSVISPTQSSTGQAHNQQMFHAQRKSIFYNTTKFLKNVSKMRPKLIFLDDLQWADKGTLNLLDYMSDRLQDYPVLIIGTYRPGDVSEKHPFKKILRKMSRKKLFDKIDLNPLGKDVISKMISEIAEMEEEDIPEDFVESMQDKTNGNPLFVRESINQMLEERETDSEKSLFPSEAEITNIPNVVQEVISNRIIELDDDTREVLQIGSVIGKKIPFDLLCEASGKDDLELLEHIDNLLENNIWEEHPREESFFFSHDLFVDTIYDGIGKWLERKFYHNKVAKAIEELRGEELEEYYSSLGHHYKKAEEFEKAFEFFYKAGEKAEEVYAHEDAIERYEESLKLANKGESVKDEKIVTLLEKLGETNNLIGNYEESRKYLHQAIGETSVIHKEKRFNRKLADSWRKVGNFDKAIQIVDEALELSEDNLPEEELGNKKEGVKVDEKEVTFENFQLLSKKAWALRRKGKYSEAKKIFQDEIEKAEKLGDKSLIAKAYHDLGSMERGDLPPEECIKYLKKAVDLRDDILDQNGSFKDRYELFRSYNNLGAIYRREGDIEKAEKQFTKALKLNRKIKNKMFETLALNNLAVLRAERGELKKAEKAIDKVMEIVEDIKYQQGHYLSENTKASIYLERGEMVKSVEHYKKALEVTEKMDFKFGMIDAYTKLSRVFIFKGNIDKARSYSTKAHELASEIQHNQSLVKALCVKGKIERLEGDVKEAIKTHKEAIEKSHETYERIDLFKNRCELIYDFIEAEEFENAEKHLDDAEEENPGVPRTNNELKFIRGVLLREQGNLDKAEGYLQKTLDEAKQLSKKYRIAETTYELALLKKQKNEKEEAKNYLDKTVELAEAMGMESLLEKSQKELNTG